MTEEQLLVQAADAGDHHAQPRLAKPGVVDQANDLAIISVEGEYSAVAQLSDSDELRQGDDMVVVGYPLDGYLPSSGNITPGLVSATSRRISLLMSIERK
jgi:S1-C subfamily serine protease